MAACACLSDPLTNHSLLSTDTQRKILEDRCVRRETDCRRLILRWMFEEQEKQKIKHYVSDTYLRYRKTVLEWMFDVSEYFRLNLSTCLKSIAYLDRCIIDETLSRKQWHLICISCISIAAKYNENEEDVPHISTWSDIIKEKLDPAMLYNHEVWILKKISWELGLNTSYCFLMAAEADDIVFSDDIMENEMKSTTLLKNSLSEYTTTTTTTTTTTNTNKKNETMKTTNKSLILQKMKGKA
jgi:hypothetical protein